MTTAHTLADLLAPYHVRTVPRPPAETRLAALRERRQRERRVAERRAA